jgi:hypothetical protein
MLCACNIGDFFCCVFSRVLDPDSMKPDPEPRSSAESGSETPGFCRIWIRILTKLIMKNNKNLYFFLSPQKARSGFKRSPKPYRDLFKREILPLFPFFGTILVCLDLDQESGSKTLSFRRKKIPLQVQL